jgi:hypothetical protein
MSNAHLVEHKNKKAAPAVPAKVIEAAEVMATTPGAPDYEALAVRFGWRDARAARRALSLPQSIRYLRDYKAAQVEHINMGNPERLRRIADEGGNAMASVQAIRTLEGMGADKEQALGAPRQSAGVTIVIESGQSARVLNQPTIDITPEPPHHWPSVD